jgi:ribonuclease Z
MPSLTLLGTGEAFDPYLSNTSLLYEGERTILIDSGFSAAQSLWRYNAEPNFLDAVLLTHHHADHTFGLPALIMVMQAANRTQPITIIGPLGTRAYAEHLFDLAYTPGLARITFPVHFVEVEPGQPIIFDPLTIKTALPNHGIPVLSTRWEVNGRPLFAYSADGKVTPATQALFTSVPTLVHECYAMPGSEGRVHSHIETVLELAAQCNTQTLVLVHCAYSQRALIANYLKTQTIFTGQVLMPEGILRLGI